MEERGLEKVILIGHGMGGPVILEAARSMPERVIGLVGADTFSDTYMARLSPEQMDYFLSSFRTDFAEGARQYALNNYFRTKTDENLKMKVILDMTGVSSEIGISSLENLLDYDGSEALQELQIPIRSINADMPLVTFKVMRANAANFSLKFMSQVRHFLMIEDPDGFNRILADFLGQIMLDSYQKNEK